MNANTKSVKLPITDEVAAGVDCSDYRGWRAVARQLERDLMLERERAEKAEADAKHYHQKCEMLQTAMYEAEEKTEAELAALKEALRNPTPEMIEDCGRRLLRFQDDSTDESFSKLQWAEVKQDAERVIAEFAAHLLKEKNT